MSIVIDEEIKGWTEKNGRADFGYENHVNADAAHGFIRNDALTPAAPHDSQALPELLDFTQRGQPLYADPAYRSVATARRGKYNRVIHRVMHKAQRNRPLTMAEMQQSPLRQDACTRRAGVRAHRPVPQEQAAALYGPGARHGNRRADQLRAHSAAADKDGVPAAGSGCGWMKIRAQETCVLSEEKRV